MSSRRAKVIATEGGMPNLATSTWAHAAASPKRVAIRSEGVEWTYQRLRDAAARLGGALAADGIGPGDRVMLIAPTCPEFVAAYLGVQAAGAIAVTPNVMSTVPELAYVIADAECSIVLAWHEIGAAPECAARAGGLRFRPLLPDLEPDWGGAPIEEPFERGHDDTAVILYTSGTTGSPKGAQITEDNLRACAETFKDILKLTPEDRLGTALPLFHIFGQAVVLGSGLFAGGSLSLLGRFSPEALVEMVRRDQVTVLAGEPTMYRALIAAAVGPEDLASLRIAGSGGASLPGAVLHEFEKRFGCTILEGYGLVESTGAATFNGLDRERKVGRVGVALPRTEVRIIDVAGEELPPGSIGEVVISGPMVMKGYWRRPADTERVLSDGALRTGDLGTKDAHGDLAIVDRLKELIICDGCNVYPREVEEVLYTHPDIREVAVIGVPDELFGEEVGAAIALTPGSLPNPEALHAWTMERLSADKVPSRFAFLEELPKGPSGKIVKRLIDREALSAIREPAGQGA